MVSETLKLWHNGAVTLPKEWLQTHPETKHYIAHGMPDGSLRIRPIVDDVIYYKDEEGRDSRC